MRTWSQMTSGLALVALLLGPLYAGDDAKKTWTFDDDETGAIAKGFTNEVGEWKVADSDNGKALAQAAKNPNSVFNVTLISDTNAKDVDLSVRMNVVRPGDVLHVDHVDGKALQIAIGLEDAAVADAAAFAVA